MHREGVEMNGACTTCGGWVAPNERLHTDEGLYHDRIDSCLTTEVVEALVAKWGCECGQEYEAHLEEEHREDQEDTSYWEMKQPGPFAPYTTEDLAVRERRFMDARLP
jgi:hypothetical protein